MPQYRASAPSSRATAVQPRERAEESPHAAQQGVARASLGRVGGVEARGRRGRHRCRGGRRGRRLGDWAVARSTGRPRPAAGAEVSAGRRPRVRPARGAAAATAARGRPPGAGRTGCPAGRPRSWAGIAARAARRHVVSVVMRPLLMVDASSPWRRLLLSDASRRNAVLPADATSRRSPVPWGPCGCAGIVADGRRPRRVPRLSGYVRPSVRSSTSRTAMRERAPPWPPFPRPPPARPASSSSSPARARTSRRCSTPSPTIPAYGAEVVAVGADRDGIAGLERAERAGLPTFVCRVKDYATRAEWDAALTEATAAYEPGPGRLGRVHEDRGQGVPRPLRRPVRQHAPRAAAQLSRGPRRARRARVRREGHRLHRPLRRRRRRHRPDHRPGRGRGPGRGRHGGSRSHERIKEVERQAARRRRGAAGPRRLPH